MQQGNRGSETWVENLIYEDRLYTITHKWHTELNPDITGFCFQNSVYNTENPFQPLPITVDGLNRGLASSRFVGLERIDGKAMNHFRHSCLFRSGTWFAIPDDPRTSKNGIALKIFSDIYVPAGRSFPWTKWLQFGDGVGPDPQNDEWFLVDEANHYPDNIVLPKECRLENAFPFGLATLLFVQQTTCDNLVPPKKPEG